ncbi:MAG: GNAT family N-acetyltransferase [Cyclobacteriaceae bacterium]
MSITILEVKTKKELRRFIKFPMHLYKKEKCYVPPLVNFELSTLDRSKNPAFEHANAKYWVAIQKGKIVGRIAGIILHEELNQASLARFGWIDFFDNKEVSKCLLDQVTKWAKENGASKIHGPMGFTDLDFEGALIEGYEYLATQATIYNFPYYQEHFEGYGLTKSVDWIEYRGEIPNEVSKRLKRTASICKSRFKLKALRFDRNKEIKKYTPAIFDLINRSYSDLYGYYSLSQNQINYYIKQYFEFVKKEFVCIVVNDEAKVIGMAIGLPSISEALQKAKGSLFPFGFAHILRAFRKCTHLDLFLIGVDPEYQKIGTHAIIFNELTSKLIEQGVQTIATGPMLEDNAGVQNLWYEFEAKITGTLKRRCYLKNI